MSLTAPDVLPNPWNVFNLQISPFWQDALGAGDRLHPLSLFVGRGGELQRLLDGLYGAGPGTSRRAIAGRPGIGKTTLIKQFKAQALAAGFLTVDQSVPIYADDTNDSVFGRVLGSVYDTVLSNRPQTIDHPAMQAAQVLVRTTRERVRGGGLSMAGFGASVSQGVASTVPSDVLIDGPRVLRDLMTLVQGSDAKGLLLHLNNLENLTETAADRAGQILRDLRDPMLMHNGLHVIIAGTQEAIQAAVMAHAQVRSVVSVLQLEPLPVADVHLLLEERYAYLRLDPTRPVIAPVAPDATATLYDLYRGDLRGLLEALDHGVTPNIGLPRSGITLRGTTSGSIRPLTFEELRPTLQRHYDEQLGALDEEHHVKRLVAWGTTDPHTPQTQQTLSLLWDVKQSTVSLTLGYLTKHGYVMPLPREGRAAQQYLLTGRSRLIFG